MFDISTQNVTSSAQSSENSADGTAKKPVSADQTKGKALAADQAAAPMLDLVAEGNAESEDNQVRMLVFGSSDGIRTAIDQLNQIGFGEPGEWSDIVSTDSPESDEYKAMLVKRVDPE